jgi:SAM-dependent methyltransferase
MSDVVGYRVAIQEERAAGLQDRVQQLLAPLDGSERAIDSGCGTGALAFALAPFVERVVGVDLSEDLVAAGNVRAPANCELIVGDATALPFEYGSFDIAGCMRRPDRLSRPGRLGRDRPLREGTRPVAHAAAPRPGHPLAARRQRPRGRDERDQAGATRPRPLPRSRRPRGRRAKAGRRDGARLGVPGRDRLVRRAQARRTEVDLCRRQAEA